MNKYFIALTLCLNFSFSFSQTGTNQTDNKGRKQGPWTKIDSAGNKVYDGQFKDGIPVGLFKHYYPKGNLKATNNYFGNGKQAAAHIYHPNGKLQGAGLYFEQKKDSLWKFYDDKEALLSEEFYSKGVKNGQWKLYYPNGKLLRTEKWKADKKDGQWMMYYDNGQPQQEINYVNGLLEGNFNVYNMSGKIIIEGNYKNDFPLGTWFYYNDFGTVHYLEQYKDGKLMAKKFQNGSEDQTYPNGIPKSKYTFKSGKKNGGFVEYYDAGSFKRRRKPADPNAIDAGNATEEWEEYIEGQKIKIQGTYLDDKLNGEVSYFTIEGKLEKKEKYVNDVLAK